SGLGRSAGAHRDGPRHQPDQPVGAAPADRTRGTALVHVLFVCLHNAGRSQMSQALFERAAQGRHEAQSAGTEPAQRVHANVVTAMAEEGIDVRVRVPRLLTTELAQWADIVVTMGCGDACPVM